MYIRIVGCGRVGSRLAIRLAHSGHEIAIVDLHRARRSLDLGPDFPWARRFRARGSTRNCWCARARKQCRCSVRAHGRRQPQPDDRAAPEANFWRGSAAWCAPARPGASRQIPRTRRGNDVSHHDFAKEACSEIYLNTGKFPELPGEIVGLVGTASELDG